MSNVSVNLKRVPGSHLAGLTVDYGVATKIASVTYVSTDGPGYYIQSESMCYPLHCLALISCSRSPLFPFLGSSWRVYLLLGRPLILLGSDLAH